jgi:zinc transport system permease protein
VLNSLMHALSYGFVQRALLAGSFISVLCAVLGIFLVLRRFSLIGDGLAHVTFGSVALGLFLRVYPFYVAVPITVLSSLGILKLTEKTRLFGDAAIGIVSSFGVASGILLASMAGGFNVDLFGYLFGNILSITPGEVAISVILCIIAITLVKIFYHDLVSVTFDEECARASGIKTKRINQALVVLTAVTVVLAMKIVGIILVSSLLIFPAATALQLARSFRQAIICAVISSLVSVFLGTIISFMLNMPTGASIVMTNFIFFMASFIYRKAAA